MAYKILVIDDETSGIEVIVDTLSSENYEILVAVNGISGYEIAKESLPDLIITDWEMANLNGIETIVLLKNNPKTEHIPIIMATGKRLFSYHLKEALEVGAVDYIRKPFEKTELKARVRSMILLFETQKKNMELEKKLHQQKIDSLEKEIEIKNKDLAEKLIQMQSVENLTEKIKLGLNNILEISNNVDINKIAKSLFLDCESKNNTNVWNEFETVFEQINEGFYENINKKYPDISQGERKMCAFIKLNLTTKEMAVLSHKTIDAVKKMRHRLRKKFDLSIDDDLSIFIQRF